MQKYSKLSPILIRNKFSGSPVTSYAGSLSEVREKSDSLVQFNSDQLTEIHLK